MSEEKSEYKTRTTIPAMIERQVLGEFDQECAFCGNKNVDLHHINGDPSHNDVMNLIPLCPTHHREQHNRRKIQIGILQLFRRYKRHSILDPKFEPIFDRMKFLNSIDEHDVRTDVGSESIIEAKDRSQELVRFIGFFAQGSFYASEIERMTKNDESDEMGNDISTFGIDHEHWREFDRPGQASYVTGLVSSYQRKLVRYRPQVEKLIVEMLVYQDWAPIDWSGKSRMP